MNKNKKLLIMHLNIRSTKADTKQIQLRNLIIKHNPDIISLNETFLKPNKSLTVDGYNIIRSDRQLRKGGGAALCIKSNLTCRELYIDNLIGDDNACGILIESNQQSLSIFTIYSPPKAAFNKDLFNYIITNHKNLIITGDLNAQSRLWHCKRTTNTDMN